MFKHKTSKEIFEELGYRNLESGDYGFRFEKVYIESAIDDYEGDTTKLISIEHMDSGDFIVVCCEKSGLVGTGHKAMGLTDKELSGINKAIKEIKTNLKKAKKRRL